MRKTLTQSYEAKYFHCEELLKFVPEFSFLQAPEEIKLDSLQKKPLGAMFKHVNVQFINLFVVQLKSCQLFARVTHS